jgi:hypothetical protein
MIAEAISIEASLAVHLKFTGMSAPFDCPGLMRAGAPRSA